LDEQPVTLSQEELVQALLTWHLADTSVNTQPEVGSQESWVQALLSLQVMVTCETPLQGLQLSIVQALLSSVLTGVNTQPEIGSQESSVQRLLSLQVIGA